MQLDQIGQPITARAQDDAHVLSDLLNQGASAFEAANALLGRPAVRLTKKYWGSNWVAVPAGRILEESCRHGHQTLSVGEETALAMVALPLVEFE